jgi:hydrogenase-4 component E
MQLYLNTFLAAVLLLNLLALGTGRLPTVIRLVTLQGGLIGLLPLLIHSPWRAESVVLAVATLITKSILIPSILMRAMREVQIRKEIEPLIGILPSMLLGALGTWLALLFASRLPLAPGQENSLLVPASFATVLTGCIFLTSRMKAVSQVVGYLILENGIFIFGLLMLEAMPFMVEMGLLLDLVVCIFVSGIILNHIKDTFDSLDTRMLTALKEDTSWPQK